MEEEIYEETPPKLHEKRHSTTLTTVSIGMGRKSSSEKEKEKPKRGSLKERWLLTRKTWKYMTDAGRNLIPVGVYNRHEDVPKIEEYFQQICKSEPKFLLWKRKSSFPGARGASKRGRRPDKGFKLKNFYSMDESINAKAQSQNADIVLNILRDYLGISDGSRQTTTLLGMNTSRPDNTDSPSSRRPIKSSQEYSTISSSPSNFSQLNKHARETQDQISELLERLRSYSQSTSRPIIPPDRITMDILEDKALLKRIYNELKKQQLHRILGKHTTPSSLLLPHSSSLSNLWNFRRSGQKNHYSTTTSNKIGNELTNKTDSHHQLNTLVPLILLKKPLCEKSYNTRGTQTDFIPLNEIQRLAKEYEKQKKEEQIHPATDLGVKHDSTTRRKSSIDNEDVSQSVSDTIKRYLRMARRKSAHDDNANRFKRVNYDRNLRNIYAKNGIDPFAMDEDNSKATQTLDSWPLLLINHIRGIDNPKLLENSHADWHESLMQRIKHAQEFEKQQKTLKEEQSSGSLQFGTKKKKIFFFSFLIFCKSLAWIPHYKLKFNHKRSNAASFIMVKITQ